MEHLSLEVFDLSGQGSKYAFLPDDAEITVTDTSDIFAKGDVWTFDFTLSIPANAHIFGTSGETHGQRLHDIIDRRRARLWAEGLPLFLGYLRLDSEASVDKDGNVDVRFEGGQKTFDEMIEGGKANQVPMMGDVLIGMALWRKRKTRFTLGLQASAVLDDGTSTLWGDVFYQTRPHEGTIGLDVPFAYDGEDEGVAVQEYPRMVFPRLRAGTFVNAGTAEPLAAVDCINTDHPYTEDGDGTPAHPYCNVALCYQRYGYDRTQTDGSVVPDYSSEPEAQRGYEYMPACRLNSAPNFFVIYWIRALMKHLGIHVEENQMMGVEDLRRLFFVNTDCAYREPKSLRTGTVDQKTGRYRFAAGSRLVPEFYGHRVGVEEGDNVFRLCYKRGDNINIGESRIDCSAFSASDAGVKSISLQIVRVKEWDEHDLSRYEDDNGYLHEAYATSECFPDADISDVIKAVEGGFGVRFLFGSDYKTVRIVLLREVLRDKSVQEIPCDVVESSKVENSVRGFRMTYGESEDTAFRYKGFDDMLPHKPETWKDSSDTHDYSKWDLAAEYGDIIKKVSAFDKTCYVTPVTGNAYGVKIDKDAKRYRELYPALFGYADFMDAEDGDCTGDDETVETVTVGFRPAIMNDLNMEEERKGRRSQRFALFVDEKMRPRRPDLKNLPSIWQPFVRSYDDPDAKYDVNNVLYGFWAEGVLPVYLLEHSDLQYDFGSMMADDGIVKPGEFAVMSDVHTGMEGYQLHARLKYAWPRGGAVDVDMNIDGYVNDGYRLYLQDNYEPNDDGVSPVEKHGWGLTLGIMRGSGGDMHVDYSPDPDDGEGNDTWEVTPGTSVTAHPDTCDNYGSRWDYNGTGQGIGDEEGRVSLKLRAEKPNPLFDASKEEGGDNLRYLPVTGNGLAHRGLADQFYKEYSYWVRNARIGRRTVRMELATLLAIDKTKRVRVGDVTGFVRKMQYTLSKKRGLGMVTMEIMYI